MRVKVKYFSYLLATLVILVLVSGSLSAVASTEATDLKVTTLAGREVSLADMKGQVVLVNFFATWCLPCRLEMPHLVKLYNQRAKDGLTVLALAVEPAEKKGAVERFVSEMKMGFPVALASQEDVDLFGGLVGIPTSFLIDKQGVVVKRFIGLVPPEQLDAAVTEALAAK